MLENIDGFDHDMRFEIYEVVDNIANKLWKSPKSRVLIKTRSNADFLPIRDYHYFIKEQEHIFP